jgi:hypothetical protein
MFDCILFYFTIFEWRFIVVVNVFNMVYASVTIIIFLFEYDVYIIKMRKCILLVKNNYINAIVYNPMIRCVIFKINLLLLKINSRPCLS